MGLIRRLIKKAPTDKGVYSFAEELALNSPQDIQRGDDYRRMFTNNGVKAEELEELGLNELFKRDRVSQREILDTIAENRIEFEVSEYKGSAPTNFNFDRRTLTFEEAEGPEYVQERVAELIDEYPDYGNPDDFADIEFRNRSEVDSWLEGDLPFDKLSAIDQELIEDYAKNVLKQMYDDDPVTEVRLIIDGEETDYALINQEGTTGREWYPRGDAPPFLFRAFDSRGARDELPTDVSEAEVQLQSLAMEMDELNLEPSDGLRWLSYTLPGGTNPQELVFKLKLPEIRFSEGVHYDDEVNQIFHVRTKDREGPDGEKILYIEEFQSDWGQTGRREGFKDPALFKKAGADAEQSLQKLAEVNVPLEALQQNEIPILSVRHALNLVGTGKLDLDTIYGGDIPKEIDYRTDQLRTFSRLSAAVDEFDRDIRSYAAQFQNGDTIDILTPERADEFIEEFTKQTVIERAEPSEAVRLIERELSFLPKDAAGNYDRSDFTVRSIIGSHIRKNPGIRQQIDRALRQKYGLEEFSPQTFTTLADFYVQQAKNFVGAELAKTGVPADFLETIKKAVTRFETDPDNAKALEMISPYSNFQERAPFVTSSEGWNQLGIKYIFNKAESEGYDGVAFTPGEVHFNRWNKEGLIDAYNKTIPYAISKVINPATPTSNKNKRIIVDDEPNDIAYSSRIYRFEDPTKDGKTIREKSKRNPMFMVPIGAGVVGLQALTPEQAAAQEMTAAEAQTMMRDVPEERTGIGSIAGGIGDTLYGAGEVAYEGLSDLLLEPLMGMAGAEAAFESGASAEEIEEARKRAIGLIDFETQSPRGRELKASALEGLGSLGEYLMDESNMGPAQLLFQKAIVPASEAITEAGLGIIGLDPRDNPEQERMRREAARPVVEAVQPIL